MVRSSFVPHGSSVSVDAVKLTVLRLATSTSTRHSPLKGFVILISTLASPASSAPRSLTRSTPASTPPISEIVTRSSATTSRLPEGSVSRSVFIPEATTCTSKATGVELVDPDTPTAAHDVANPRHRTTTLRFTAAPPCASHSDRCQMQDEQNRRLP